MNFADKATLVRFTENKNGNTTPMSNALFNHRSIRKFKDTPVPELVLNRILEAAVRGSNTGNLQFYSIIVTTNISLKEKLWAYHFKQDMVKQAPVILTFCADINRFNRYCEQREATPVYDNFLWFVNGVIDAVIAAQNASLEAENNGLGICYLGTTTYMAQPISELLQLPKGVAPVTSVVVGYPDENPGLTERLPLEAVVHYQQYKQFSESDIQAIYSEFENLEKIKNLIIENNVENMAQIITQKRYNGKDNKLFSQKYLEFITNQGFMNND